MILRLLKTLLKTLSKTPPAPDRCQKRLIFGAGGGLLGDICFGCEPRRV
jgi:hypothetical protein